MHNWLYRVLALAAVVSMSGCAVLDELDQSFSSKPSSPADVGAVIEPEPAKPPVVMARRATPEITPRPKRKPDIVDPKTLVGLDKASISALFGEPHRITMAQPALVWSWATVGCEMRLFLYPDVADKTFRALAYEINAAPAKHKAVMVDTCASRLKWAHAEATR